MFFYQRAWQGSCSSFWNGFFSEQISLSLNYIMFLYPKIECVTLLNTMNNNREDCLYLQPFSSLKYGRVTCLTFKRVVLQSTCYFETNVPGMVHTWENPMLLLHTIHILNQYVFFFLFSYCVYLGMIRDARNPSYILATLFQVWH